MATRERCDTKGDVDGNTIDCNLHHDTNTEKGREGEVIGTTCFDIWIQLVYKNTDFRLGYGLRHLRIHLLTSFIVRKRGD